MEKLKLKLILKKLKRLLGVIAPLQRKGAIMSMIKNEDFNLVKGRKI